MHIILEGKEKPYLSRDGHNYHQRILDGDDLVVISLFSCTIKHARRRHHAEDGPVPDEDNPIVVEDKRLPLKVIHDMLLRAKELAGIDADAPMSEIELERLMSDHATKVYKYTQGLMK